VKKRSQTQEGDRKLKKIAEEAQSKYKIGLK
jgi:hypothetical protein